jgi:HSP20 family protein
MQPYEQALLSSVLRKDLSVWSADGNSSRLPSVNVVETDSAYFVELALPGYQKMNLGVKLENEVLEVKGTSISRPYRNVIRTLVSEFSSPEFRRSFILPGNIKEVVAWFEAGVLYVQLLKSQGPYHIKDKEVLIQ